VNGRETARMCVIVPYFNVRVNKRAKGRDRVNERERDCLVWM